MRGLAWMWMLLVGCSAAPPIDTDLTTTNGGQPTPTTDPGPQYDEVGHVGLIIRHAEPENDPTIKLAGIFADSTKSWINLGQCLALKDDAFCTQQVPDVKGAWVATDPYEDDLIGSLDTVSVGASITLGSFGANEGENNGLTIYYNNNAGTVPPADGSLVLAFAGGALGDFTADDVVAVPDPIEVLNFDPTRPQTLTQDPFTLNWTPGLRGDVYLSVTSETVSRLYWLEDNGTFELDVDTLGLADEDAVTLTLARWTRSSLDHDGARIEFLVQDEQVIRATYRDLPNRTPIEVADDCTTAALLPAVQSGSYYARVQDAANDYAPSGCVTGGNGPDVFLRAELNPDGEISVQEQLLGANAVAYLMTDCGDFGTCVDGANNAVTNNAETVTWVNTTNTVQDVYLGFDSTAAPLDDLLLINVDIVQVNQDTLVDSCAEAIYNPPITSNPPGTSRHVGNITTFHNYTDPAGACGVNGPAAEGMVKVELQSNQTLTADVFMPGADPVLYVLYNCAVSASCPVGSDADATSDESLTYQNLTPFAEVLYLVVDSNGLSGSYTLDVLIQ